MLAALERGEGGVLLAGAPGVGKSRLAREILSRAEVSGWHVVRVTATLSTQALPFGAVLPLLPSGLASLSDRVEVLRAVSEHLVREASGRRLVLGVDDAHLLDDLSAVLVAQVATAGLGSLVVTARSGVGYPDALSSLYRNGHIDRLEVQQLSEDEVTVLLEAVLGGQVEADTAVRLWATSAGNVLYLSELMADAFDAGALAAHDGLWRWSGGIGPASRLAEVVETRLGGLNAGEAELLALVAFGEPLEVAAAEDLVPEATASLERQGLVEVTDDTTPGGVVRLGHPIYGEVVRARTGRGERTRLHRRLCEAIDRTGTAGGGDPLRMALWQAAAGLSDDPGGLAEAAERANRMGDAGSAVGLAQAALAVGPSFRASLQLAAACNEQGRFSDAETVLAGLAEMCGDDRDRQSVAYQRMRALFYGLGRLEDACGVLEAAESAIGEPKRRDLVRAWRSMVLAHAGQVPQAEVLAADLAASSERAVRVAAQGTITTIRLRAGHVVDAVCLAERCVGESRNPDGQVSVVVGSLEVLALQADGRLHDAAAALDALDRGDARRPAADGDRAMILTLRGSNALLGGRPVSALRALREAAVLLRRHDAGGFLRWCLSLQVEAAALVEDRQRALEAGAEAEAVRSAGVGMFDADGARARMWADVAGGDPTGAAVRLRALGDDLVGRGEITAGLHALHDALRLGGTLTALGDLVAVARMVDSRLAAAVAAQADGMSRGDIDALEAAATAFETLGAVVMAAETWAQAATAARSGDRVRSAAAHRHRVDLGRRCEGAHTPLLATPAETSSLTVREREVAALAASGLTNREIAARLVTSVRTIDGHLYHVFAKLGVTSRDGLRGYLDDST